MSNVIEFTGETKADIDPDIILEEAKGKLDKVIMLGVDKDNVDFYASSSCSIPELLFHVERFKTYLIDISYREKDS